MLFIEILILGAAIAFLAIDPKEELATNVLLIIIIVGVFIHAAINVLFICRGNWLCFNCK